MPGTSNVSRLPPFDAKAGSASIVEQVVCKGHEAGTHFDDRLAGLYDRKSRLYSNSRKTLAEMRLLCG